MKLSFFMNEEVSDEWVCIDDGTGRNLYYQNLTTGSLSRVCPENLKTQSFEYGKQKFYYRGNCIRCRKKEIPSVITMKSNTIAYSFNVCDQCVLDTTRVTKISGNGDKIWETLHEHTPCNTYYNLFTAIDDNQREDIIIRRAQEARYDLQLDEKLRRDMLRLPVLKESAHQYGIITGKYLSWGLGTIYDEYYGQTNNDNLPHGLGIKVFSDKSIYVGEFKDGCRHTSNKALWIRPDGYDYEGQFLSDLKHGYGELKYPNGTVYKGEFARDFEHGNGKMFYYDGTQYEGKFRFGKRDGLGVLTHRDGTITKSNFRDNIIYYHEKPIAQLDNHNDELNPDVTFFQPLSLYQIANKRLAEVINSNKITITSDVITKRLPNHLKSTFAKVYLNIRHSTPLKQFIDLVHDKAFKYSSDIDISSVKLSLVDIQTLLFFQSANNELKCLKLTANHLDPQCVGLLCQKISQNIWPLLHTIDLSFNQLDVSSIRAIVQVASDQKTIEVLRLSGCKIQSNGAFVIANVIENNHNIKILDLSFNSIKGPGAEALAEALSENTTITSLNIRNNDIGIIGGNAFAELLRINRTLKTLCLIDNDIGTQKMALISCRLSGNIKDVLTSVRSSELTVPSRYSYSFDKQKEKKSVLA